MSKIGNKITITLDDLYWTLKKIKIDEYGLGDYANVLKLIEYDLFEIENNKYLSLDVIHYYKTDVKGFKPLLVEFGSIRMDYIAEMNIKCNFQIK